MQENLGKSFLVKVKIKGILKDYARSVFATSDPKRGIDIYAKQVKD